MLNVTQRMGYAIGDLGINLYFMSVMTYLLFFYTDVYGLSAAVAGGVFLVARIVDAVTDPIMGFIADRTRSRWGKLRPYLLYGPVPLALISVATFTVPGFDGWGKVVWAYATYVAFGIFYTVVTIPYAAMTALLTDQHQERTLLSTVRIGCAFAGGYIVSVGMLPAVAYFGGGAQGFQWTMVVFSIAATLLLWVTFARTRERIEIAPRDTVVTLKDGARVLMNNGPLVIVMLLFTLGMLAFTVRQTAAAYYFKYNMGREDLLPFYFGITLPIMFLGLAAVPWLSRRFGKAGGIRVGAVVAMIGAGGFYLTPPESVSLVFLFGCILALGGAPIAVLGWAMIPDTVEYAQWQTGVRADGVIYATTSFFQKLGKAIGGAGVAGLLALFGYVANEAQSEDSLRAILWMMSVAPLVINLLLLMVSLIYRLDEDTHTRIVSDLRERAS